MEPQRGAVGDEAPAVAAAPAEKPTYGASLLAIALTFIVLWVGIYFGMSAFIVGLFAGPMYLIAIPLVMAAVAVGVAYVAKRATGRRHIGAAILVTIAAVVSMGFALGHFGTIPMIWVWPGLEAVYPLVALSCGLLLGVFLGPQWIRVAGALAAAGLVAVLIAIQEPTPGADLTRPYTEEEQFAQFAAVNAGTLVPDGFTVARVGAQPGAGLFAWVLTPQGGMVTVAYDLDYAAEGHEAGNECGRLVNLDSSPPESVDDYSSWCATDADGWARTDGTGFTRMRDGGLVAVTAADQFAVANFGAYRSANADEVAAALASLRPITEAELRLAFENQKVPAEDP